MNNSNNLSQYHLWIKANLALKYISKSNKPVFIPKYVVRKNEQLVK